MSEHHFTEPFPRLPLIGAALLLALTLGGAIMSRQTGIGHSALADAPVVASESLRFVDRADGGIDVLAAPGGEKVALVAPGSNNFLRGTLRGLARERMRRGIGAEAPFTLTARSDGRLILSDATTGRSVDLEAFGSTNEASFAQLLPRASSGVASAPLVLLGASDDHLH